jgi:hypothetical protein
MIPMSDKEIRFRLAEVVARNANNATEALAILEALYRFVTKAKS